MKKRRSFFGGKSRAGVRTSQCSRLFLCFLAEGEHKSGTNDGFLLIFGICKVLRLKV